MARGIRVTRARLLIGGVALLLILAVTVIGLQGGFRRAAPPAERVEVGEEFAWGPFAVTVTGAHSVVRPARFDGEDDTRELVLLLDVEVTSGHVESTGPLSQVRPSAGDLLMESKYGDQAAYRNAVDSRSLSRLNPGLVHEVALVWDQPRDWDGDEVSFTLRRLLWLEDDWFDLDNERWAQLHSPQFTVDVPVEREAS